MLVAQQRMRRHFWCMSTVRVFSVCVLLAFNAFAGLRTEVLPEGAWVKEGGRKVLFFQRTTKSLDGKYARANYVHPLFDLDGNVLTEDFPADHRHHRGIFWAWHQLWVGDRKIGDGWIAKDLEWDVYSLKAAVAADGTARIETKVNWKSPLWHDGRRALVKETALIHVHPQKSGLRKIDFDIRLLAVEPNMRLGGSENDKGYGGFSPRIRLPEGIRFLGEKGEVEPQRTAVTAGPWMDMTAKFAGDGLSGVTVLTHPKSAGFPQPWILRRKGSMQNAVWPGQHAQRLPVKQPLVLCYRLVLHRGVVDAKVIGKWQKEFAATP